ncbi:MAG: hypothetical protein ACFFA7_09465 [Promethearchaeota archaeon]
MSKVLDIISLFMEFHYFYLNPNRLRSNIIELKNVEGKVGE